MAMVHVVLAGCTLAVCSAPPPILVTGSHVTVHSMLPLINSRLIMLPPHPLFVQLCDSGLPDPDMCLIPEVTGSMLE